MNLPVAVDHPVTISVDLVAASYRSDTFPQEWSRADRERALVRYEKWLQLVRRHPDARVAPTPDIDLFWHLHMLWPVAYVRDCTRLFGHVLDHDPCFGQSDGEVTTMLAAFQDTASWWEEEYREAYRDEGAWMRDAGTESWQD
jgi:hypothetical protein